MKNCNLYGLGLCASKENPQPLSNFYEAKSSKDGRAPRCKSCIKEYAHRKRLERGGGQLKIPKRPPSVPLTEKNCSKFLKGTCVSEINPQPITNFRSKLGRVNGSSICKSCEFKYQEDHREEAIVRTRKWARDPKNMEKRKVTNRMKVYGLSESEYNALFVSQNGCCAICKNHSSVSRLVVDHCHNSNKVRALLCNNCNRGIGFFKEQASTIEAALEFLKKHNSA